jgi:TRAP-type C4-dicarboxylate transport system substrate-binding protein
MLRRTALRLIAAAVVLAGVSVGNEARAAEVIKIGTLWPQASPWGQVFKVWAEAVSQKSGGRIELQFFYNGSQGDEAAMVGKMKDGQLDGAAVSGVGLGKIYRPILALQMPGLFRTWTKLDAARDAMKGDFDKGAKDAGFSILGWSDGGAVHLMSKGFVVRTPDDIKGKKPFMWRDDPIASIVFQVIGGVTPVPLNVPEVLPQLNTGAINVVAATAVGAEQLQWSSKLDTIGDDVNALAIGGIVMSSKRLDALPEDLRTIVRDTAKVTSDALLKRLRAEDDAAFVRLKGKMKVVTLTADEKAKWDALYKVVRDRLRQGTFAPEVVTKLEALAK